ncbi:hypothetical protein NMH_1877 [Neisseria meningitidis H44/76]|uniref:Uncharacterized protein n=1 Tax=Neisseria meningitidis serogroup B / serotype 15 (strain H44/76) TaxID=909420 RepID=E6MYN0_NEIMH|nr:hypothetical protein [Neisseria meningitidis]AJC63565.1 hypothetical protein N875_08220 [Neisseria meningitidis LNP21362]AJC64021.1 hypothetical protein N875_10935 [Neisseria meningitidis LNP21362]EFV63282.1 hypothetical protein NMH_1877 [Neisseria meningitidis H44/76]
MHIIQSPVIPTKTENQKQQSEIPSFPPVRESGLFGFGSFSRFG